MSMRAVFYNSDSFKLGQYSGLIRVNGQRSVVGIGHSPEEAEQQTLEQAKETWAHHAHIFDLIGRKPEVVA
jgi:hypothetical protein